MCYGWCVWWLRVWCGGECWGDDVCVCEWWIEFCYDVVEWIGVVVVGVFGVKVFKFVGDVELCWEWGRDGVWLSGVECGMGELVDDVYGARASVTRVEYGISVRGEGVLSVVGFIDVCVGREV